MNERNIVFGALAPMLWEQFNATEPHQQELLRPWQKCADAIVQLRVKGIITQVEADKCRERLLHKLQIIVIPQ